MATTSGVWGIDLGQCALKALRLEVIDDQLTATAFDYVEHPKILSQPDADPDQLTREALEKFLSRNELKGDAVAISVPGQSGLARFVKLPPVEEKKIADIVKFEAKQQIPFNLDEVVWDYQKIGSGTVTDGFALDTEIGLFAIKRDMVNRYLQHFKDVNVEVHLVQMAPLALCNFVGYDLLQRGKPEGDGEEKAAYGKKQCVVALDIGTDASNLVITDGERIIWQRPIPLGGNHFTRALTKDLKLTFAKAEHLKRNATKTVDKNIDLKKILSSLKPVLNDFVGEVQRSLGYFTNTHRDAQIEYMVGLGNAFRLPGLQKFLSEKLGLNVKKLAKMQQLSGDVLAQPVFSDNVLSFAVAYGLALQGLKVARIQTNLLPHEIRVERLIRAKKPWAVAAASALLLGTAGCAISYALEYQAYTNPKVVEAMKKGDEAVKLASGKKSAYDSAKTEASTEENAVKSVIAGQEERLNWLALNRFITECLPRPDPTSAQTANLTPSAYMLYGSPTNKENEGVGHAFANFKTWRNRTTTNVSALSTEKSEAWLKDLILVNVEAVDCRYADNLATVWDSVKAVPRFQQDILHTVRPRPPAQAGADPNAPVEVPPPEGAGWVVELRGYTFHRGKRTFVLNSLVDNIARYGAPPAPPAPAGGEDPAKAPAKPAHPVVGKVSHVLVLKSLTDGTSFIGGTFLDALLTTPAAGQTGEGGTGSGEMQQPGTGGGSSLGGGTPVAGGRGGWVPLTSSGGDGRGLGTGSGMRPPGGGGMSAPLNPLTPSGGGSGRPLGPTDPDSPRPGGGIFGGGGGDTTGKKGALERTEFSIIFFWKEHTPSDGLMKPVEGATTP